MKRSMSWVTIQGDEYQNFLIFIAHFLHSSPNFLRGHISILNLPQETSNGRFYFLEPPWLHSCHCL